MARWSNNNTRLYPTLQQFYHDGVNGVHLSTVEPAFIVFQPGVSITVQLSHSYSLSYAKEGQHNYLVTWHHRTTSPQHCVFVTNDTAFQHHDLAQANIETAIAQAVNQPESHQAAWRAGRGCCWGSTQWDFTAQTSVATNKSVSPNWVAPSPWLFF